MMRSKRASVLLYTMMLGLLVILLALFLAPGVQDFTTQAMTDMNCSSSLISNYDKATCTVIDLNLFYFIGALIFIGGLIVTARVMFGGVE